MDQRWNYTAVNDTNTKIGLFDCTVTEYENGDGYIALIFGDGFIVSDISDENRIKQKRLIGGRR